MHVGDKMWVVGQRGMLISGHGSKEDWTAVPSGTVRSLNGIDFSAGWGIIVGSRGTILKTEDAGESWVVIKPGKKVGDGN